MKIVKYKKYSKGKYKVFLEDGRELSFYDEVILQFDLLLTKDMDEKTIQDAISCNQEWDVYYVALNSLNNRYRSIYDLKNYLIKKEYPISMIENAIHKLVEQGYLNDCSYAKSYIYNQMLTSNKGPFKLEKELLEKNIDSTIIRNELLVFTDEEQISRIKKIIDKSIRSNHTRGGVVLKQKIFNDLKCLGYDISLINHVIDDYSFDNDIEIAKKEYEKLYRKYCRKYSGNDLKNKIREKLYLKGLKYEEE